MYVILGFCLVGLSCYYINIPNLIWRNNIRHYVVDSHTQIEQMRQDQIKLTLKLNDLLEDIKKNKSIDNKDE